MLCVAPTAEAVAACYDRADGMQRRFILDGGEAHDTKTSLTWKRCSLGMTWTQMIARTTKRANDLSKI
jgi:hypothetical protein